MIRSGIAIPTEFRGITFRSRFEANVAQFLVDIGIKYEYETKSFLVSGVHYCPDFFLPESGQFVEVRGYQTEGSEQTLERFALEHGELIVFYPNQAIVITKVPQSMAKEYGPVWRTASLEAVICSYGHATAITLLSPFTIHGCFICGDQRNKEASRQSLEVCVRASVPILRTELSLNIERAGRAGRAGDEEAES
jgi:hypothetical protein